MKVGQLQASLILAIPLKQIVCKIVFLPKLIYGAS